MLKNLVGKTVKVGSKVLTVSEVHPFRYTAVALHPDANGVQYANADVAPPKDQWVIVYVNDNLQGTTPIEVLS